MSFGHKSGPKAIEFEAKNTADFNSKRLKIQLFDHIDEFEISSMPGTRQWELFFLKKRPDNSPTVEFLA